jgi:glycosyltransferase involved in cell wall biosynthesis
MFKRIHLSIVSPVYKSPKILPELVTRLQLTLSGVTECYEVILVDDGCPLNSSKVLLRKL